MALASGPPATEDTAAARRWQRIAVGRGAQNIPRLRATVDFDHSAHCAARFEAWRRGEEPSGSTEAHLFQAYEKAANAMGRKRSDLVGPPRLYWSGDTLALEAEASARHQRLQLGPFPTPLQNGGRIALKAPWPNSVAWSCANQTAEIPVAPTAEEILAFDADNGVLLARIGPGQDHLDTSSRHLILLSRLAFRTGEFGEALPSADATVRIAWFHLGDTIEPSGRPPLTIRAPSEPSLAIDAPILGRDGSRPLYGCDGNLVIHIDPTLGGPNRLLRARFGSAVRYAALQFDATGLIELPLAAIGLDKPSDPTPVLFDVLAPGAADRDDARAELSLRTWVWPGLDGATGAGDTLPCPGNFIAARSAGLVAIDSRITIRHDASTEAPILGLATTHMPKAEVREFRLAVRGDRLWHIQVEQGGRALVPRGAIVGLGHSGRHDTFVLKSDDREANLLVLGKRIRRPFYARSMFEINASLLETTSDDDRIALERKSGRCDLLARIERFDDPAEIAFSQSDSATLLSFISSGNPDALRLTFETADGRVQSGEAAFSYSPVGRSLPDGASVSRDHQTGRIVLQLVPGTARAPGRGRIDLRYPGGSDFVPMTDTRDAELAFPIDGKLEGFDQAILLRLARFLSTPYLDAISHHLERTLGAQYASAMRSVGASRMVGSVRPVLDLVRPDSQPPLHDLVGVAPWIFEAAPHAFSNIPVGSGLAPLGAMGATPAPSLLPSVDSDAPLRDWFDLLEGGLQSPDALSSDRLAHGFRALRFQLQETDLSRLVRTGADATALRLLTDVHIEDIGRLRRFDIGGGGDPSAARIAALIERFARAAAQKNAEAFLARISERTGLTEATSGRLITLSIRAGAHVFAYFRMLWHYAALSGAAEKTEGTE